MNTTTLATRAVKCPRWEWRDGMAVTYHNGGKSRVCRDANGNLYLPIGPGPNWRNECLPDLDDDGTLGCLHGLVRDVRKEPRGRVAMFSMDPESFAWDDGSMNAQVFHTFATEAEVMVDALERAP